MKETAHSIDYAPKGVCSRLIHVEERGGSIAAAHFVGGCNGNLQGICSLIQGQPVGEVIKRLEGIRCGGKPTSCPDQLAQALKTLQKMQEEGTAGYDEAREARKENKMPGAVK